MRPTDQRLTKEERTALAELFNKDRTAFAEVITEYVDPVYLTLDLMGQFMNTREMAPGQILVKQFKGKYNVQQIVPGEIRLGQQITLRNKAMSYAIDILSAGAMYNELEMRNGGPAYTPETIRSDVQKALDEKLVMRTWNALGNIWTTANASALTVSGAANSNFLDAAGPLTASVLDAAIDHTNYWADSVRTIIGTETALAPLSEFGQYKVIGAIADTHPGILQQIQGTPGTYQNVSPYGNGSKAVETYRGVTNIVRLKQIFDKTEYPWKPLLPTNFVLVIGDNIGEFVTFGGAETKEWTDNEPTPPYWHYDTWIQFGMMIWNAKGITKIKVTPAAIP